MESPTHSTMERTHGFSRAGLGAGLTTFIRHRHLLWQFTARNISIRHRGSHLGVFWTVLNPLLLLGLYTFVFGVIFGGKFGVLGKRELPRLCSGSISGAFHVQPHFRDFERFDPNHSGKPEFREKGRFPSRDSSRSRRRSFSLSFPDNPAPLLSRHPAFRQRRRARHFLASAHITAPDPHRLGAGLVSGCPGGFFFAIRHR